MADEKPRRARVVNRKPGTRRTAAPAGARPRCGLCGKTRQLMRTECCDQWICDDEHTYVLFSYARNSCARNHRRYTLCGFHSTEEHAGDWRACRRCREAFQTEMYVWYGTNAYNFVKLENPPPYDPTRCTRCGAIVRLGEDAYTMKGEAVYCARCSPALR